VTAQLSKTERGTKTCGLCDGTGFAICNACYQPRAYSVRVSIRGRIAQFFGKICWACLILESTPAILPNELEQIAT